MSPKVQNIDLEEDTDTSIDLTFTSDTTGLPLNFTGAVGELLINRGFGNDELLLKVLSSDTTPPGQTPTAKIELKTEGVVTLTFNRAISTLFDNNFVILGAYHISVEKASVKSKLLKGFITILK